MSEKSEEVQVNLEEIKPIESSSIDLKKFDKKEVEIESVKVMRVPSKYTDCGFQYVLRVSSKVLETLGEGDDAIQFKASELFNLIQDDKGAIIGYPTGEGSNLVQFMKDIGADFRGSNLKELISGIVGRKALIKTYDKEVDGRVRTYLKFRY